MDTEDLSSLLQAAEQLSSQTDEGVLNDLPRVERNLRQVVEAGQQLWNKTSQAAAPDGQGAILLGSRGVDLTRLSHKLDSLSAVTSFEPLEPLRVTDIQGFLQNERENAILSVIEETRNATFERAQQMYWDSVKSSWEKEKQKLYNTLMGSAQEPLDVSLPSSEVTLGGRLPSTGRSLLDSQEMAYAKEVVDYNEQIIRGGIRPNLADKFAQVAKKLEDQNIIDLWEMVRTMCDIPFKITGDVVKSRMQPSMQTAIINTSRRFLEERYKSFMQQTVFSNPGMAKLGGIPGTLPLVRSFVATRQIGQMTGLEDGNLDGQPIWALIFYCLRCGDISAAFQAAKQAGPSTSEMARMLGELLQSTERRLSPSSETAAKLLYKKNIRASSDPFKRASYCIVGACDFSDDQAEIAVTTDDYLWVKMCQLREDDAGGLESAHDKNSISQFQTLILEEYGERHFQAYQEPFLYFEVLFLTGQFEAAVEFLSRIERLRCHAVHVALALMEANLLVVPCNIQAPMISREPADKASMRRLNVARLIMLYTRKFEATDPKEALHYFYFLRGIKGSDGDSVFTACVSELVLESREFDLLLGKLEADGCRSPGLIDYFRGHQVDTPKIIELVAKDTEAKGMFEDSIHLYELARRDDKVVELLCRLLSTTVALPAPVESPEWRLQNRAVSVARRLRTSSSIPPDQISTFYLLLDLGTFFSLYHFEKYNEALDAMGKLRLVPFTMEDIEPHVASFRGLSDEVRRNIPDVLLASMNILNKKYLQLKSGVGFSSPARRSEADREKSVNQLRSQARALVTFAGMVPYHMPANINARLVQLEALLH